MYLMRLVGLLYSVYMKRTLSPSSSLHEALLCKVHRYKVMHDETPISMFCFGRMFTLQSRQNQVPNIKKSSIGND
jgi:hypothetical protein